ncbi:MAG: hypothetical protein RLN62_07075 [Rickettsiales bacterium]
MLRYDGYHYLPLLQYVEKLFPKGHLDDVYLLACQHILPSTHMMLRSMVNLGLKKDRVALIGKCYSTNKITMENMRQEGFYVCESSSKFKPESSFDEQFRSNIYNFVHSQFQRMQPNKNARIIFLDDGGEMLSIAQDLSRTYSNFFGVEQTSSGYHKLAYNSINFPIKNVALSNEKLNFESPFIAVSVLKCLEQRIALSTLLPKQILIVGNGYIGKEVCTLLKGNQYNHHKVIGYDVVHDKSELDYVDFSQFDIILGATGNRMMTHNYYDSLKNNAVLASVSSSDREFDAVHFRRLSGVVNNVHDDVFYNGFCLLNSGFPLNFNGDDRVSVPLGKIQLVCALLVLAVCEYKESNQQQKQFVRLDKELTEKIVGKFNIIDRRIGYEKFIEKHD